MFYYSEYNPQLAAAVGFPLNCTQPGLNGALFLFSLK